MIELKPCPFCGGEAERIVDKGEKYKALFVQCKVCGARVKVKEFRLLSYMRPLERYGETVLDRLDFLDSDAERAWNRRQS